MTFEVPPEWASEAIIECVREVLEGTPGSGRHVFRCGNGLWTKPGTSDYFNCGVNQFEGTPPAEGDVGTLSSGLMDGLEKWFREKYGAYKPDVLRKAAAPKTRNFVLVYKTYALNFHLEVK